MDCASCASKIEDNLAKLEEVKFVNVNFASSTMTIDTDNLEKVRSKIKEIEPDVELEDSDKAKTIVSVSELSENKRTIIKAVAGLALLLIGLIFQEKLHNTPFHLAEYAVFVTGYFIVGWGVLTSAVKNIIGGQVFNEQFTKCPKLLPSCCFMW
jgi:Cd2+/Zn2+-exporting ATPase